MSQQSIIIWITIIAYFVLMAVIGILNSKSSRGGVANFTVGKRNAGAWISALSYGTAYFSAVMFIGYSGKSGWNFWLWAVLVGLGNAVFGSWLAWKVLAGRTRKISTRLHIKSMPQFFLSRYSSPKMRTFSAVVIFLFLTPYSASVYTGLSSVCSVVLNIDETVCRIIIAVASILILTLGGYIATLKADFVQGIILVVGIILLIFFVVRSNEVGGISGISKVWDDMKQAKGIRPLSSDNTISLVATIIMTSFGTWGLPQMIHKYYSIKDEREVKRGTVISTIFAVIVAGGGYFVGSLSHSFLTEPRAGKTDNLIPDMLRYLRESGQLPVVLLGVILVLLISASVSTLSAITLTASSTVSMDLIKPKMKKEISDKKLSWFIRGFCVLFVIMSYVIAATDTPIFDMMSYSWGIISGSFLAPYLLSLYWKRLNRTGAWIGMLVGFFTAIIPATSKIVSLIMGDSTPEVFKFLLSKGAEFAVVAMVLSLIACFICGWLFKHKDEQQEKDTEFFYNGKVEIAD